jgi:hypothetical protein
VRLDAVGVAICVIREFLDSAMVLCHSAERALVGILRPNRNVGIHIFMPESGSMFSLITPSSPVSDRRSKNIPHQASPRGRSPTYPKAVVRSEDFPGASVFFSWRPADCSGTAFCSAPVLVAVPRLAAPSPN